MTDRERIDFFFEQNARKDIRIWMALVVGLVLLCVSLDDLIGPGFFKPAEGPTWLKVVMFLAGLGMFVTALTCLVFNASRGCFLNEETEELIWWQMRFAHQGSHTKSKIKLLEIAVLRIDNSNDGLEVSMYNSAGKKQDNFSEAVLPKDSRRWIKSLVSEWPHIRIEEV